MKEEGGLMRTGISVNTIPTHKSIVYRTAVNLSSQTLTARKRREYRGIREVDDACCARLLMRCPDSSVRGLTILVENTRQHQLPTKNMYVFLMVVVATHDNPCKHRNGCFCDDEGPVAQAIC